MALDHEKWQPVRPGVITVSQRQKSACGIFVGGQGSQGGPAAKGTAHAGVQGEVLPLKAPFKLLGAGPENGKKTGDTEEGQIWEYQGTGSNQGLHQD